MSLLITRKLTSFVLAGCTIIMLFTAIESFSSSSQTLHLFKIERSKNANVVQYDVQVKADGMLDAKEPVIAYWVRLAKDGQKEDLKWVEKQFAYGFKAKYNPKTNTATLEMVAKINRQIKVIEVQGEYRAETTIDGQPAYLDKIFISAQGKGLSTEVTSIELFGRDKETGDDRYEKLAP